MKRVIINIFCIVFTVFIALSVLHLKQIELKKESELKHLYQKLQTLQKNIHELKNRWAILNQPERLKVLIESQMNLKMIKADQMQTTESLATTPLLPPLEKPESIKKDNANAR